MGACTTHVPVANFTKSFIYNILKLAERVGFEPANPSHINTLGQFLIAQIVRIAPKPEHQVQNRYSEKVAFSADRGRALGRPAERSLS